MKTQISVSESVHDKQFTGTIDFDGRIFTFTVTFNIPISRIDAEMEAREMTPAEVPQHFPIALHAPDKKPVELSNDEYGFLFVLLGELCVYMHNCELAKVSTDPHGRLATKARELDPNATIQATLTRQVELEDDSVPERFRTAA